MQSCHISIQQWFSYHGLSNLEEFFHKYCKDPNMIDPEYINWATGYIDTLSNLEEFFHKYCKDPNMIDPKYINRAT